MSNEVLEMIPVMKLNGMTIPNLPEHLFPALKNNGNRSHVMSLEDTLQLVGVFCTRAT